VEFVSLCAVGPSLAKESGRAWLGCTLASICVIEHVDHFMLEEVSTSGTAKYMSLIPFPHKEKRHQKEDKTGGKVGKMLLRLILLISF